MRCVMQTWFITISLVGCAFLLISEQRNSPTGKWLSKPIAAAAFIALALSNGAMDSAYGEWILLGLCLSWLGDVLLIPKEQKKCFLAGIASFLAAHIAYSLGFVSIGFQPLACLISGLVAFLFGLVIYRWLAPRLSGLLRMWVPTCVAVIVVMVVLSISAAGVNAQWLPVVGAVLFAISDISVARDRFVTPAFINRAWGLPLYFVAQLILASTVPAGM